jgi:hypothetical protein
MMMQQSPLVVPVILGACALGWWAIAPLLVSVPDPRLGARNPDHHARLVRFYRGWGFSAIVAGALIALVL